MNLSLKNSPLLLSLFLSFLFVTGAYSQRISTSSVPAVYIVRYNNTDLKLASVSFTDAVDANNKPVYTVNMNISLTDDPAIKTILGAFNTEKMGLRSKLSLSLLSYTSGMQPVDVRNYSEIQLQEIQIPALDASLKNGLSVSIRFTAPKVNITAGEKVGVINTKIRLLTASSFRFKLGNLPCTRVTKTGALVKNLNTTGSVFAVELSAVDAAAWSQWFQTGSGGRKKEQGTIELLSADMKTAVFTINLNDVSITSYSSGSATGGTIAKVTAGLNAASFFIK